MIVFEVTLADDMQSTQKLDVIHSQHNGRSCASDITRSRAEDPRIGIIPVVCVLASHMSNSTHNTWHLHV